MIGGNQEEVMPAENSGRYKTEVEKRIERRERLAPRNIVNMAKHVEIYRGVKRRDRNERVFARPNGLGENAEKAIFCRGPGPARKKKEVYQ